MDTNEKVYELFTIPEGTKVDKIASDDPLATTFKFTLPDGSIKFLDVGPSGVRVTTFEVSQNVQFDVGYADAD